MRILRPSVTSSVIGSFIAVRTVVIASDWFKVGYVWLVCGRVDGSAQVIGVGVEVGSALA